MSAIKYEGVDYGVMPEIPEQTPEDIVLTGDMTGESVFDEETGKNIVETFRKQCRVFRENAIASEPTWYKIADAVITYVNASLGLVLLSTYSYDTNSKYAGILKVSARVGNHEIE